MKEVKRLWSWLAIPCIALAVLTGSILPVLLVRGFYTVQIGPLGICEASGLTRQQAAEAFGDVMDYCMGRRPDFAAGVLPFSAEGAGHFADVRGLFLLVVWVFVAAAGLLLAGFLLYCSLSAIGGSMAGKAEDLSSTNVLFSLVLVASFFCCMFAGGMDGMTSSARWLDYVPFTAILVTPSRVLLGQTSLLGGLVSLALVVVCAGVLTALAGQVYRLMSLYKGNPPTPRRVLRMLREK